MVEAMIALLRGVNVGTAKRVAMADLRGVVEGLGCADVRTHLNSGNVVFTAPPELVATAAERIERAVADDLGVTCAVVTRTGAQLLSIIEANPLSAGDPSKTLVGFFPSVPTKSRVAELIDGLDEPDHIAVLGSELYLWCPDGVLKSPFAKVAWEKALGVPVTMRNWNTTRKLGDLVAAIR